MKYLYARFVLFLIRPALELHATNTKRQREKEVDGFILNLIAMGDNDGFARTALESIYGLKRGDR